jgi:hypothetical protein
MAGVRLRVTIINFAERYDIIEQEKVWWERVEIGE